MKTKNIISEMIRVNHAGEYGAERIYKGQKAVLNNLPLSVEIDKMLNEESIHLQVFNDLINKRRIRPTILSPVWHIGGYTMGLMTAMLGPKYTMACTEAVEEIIYEHYTRQAKFLENKDKELFDIVNKFAEEEKKHKEKAINHGTGNSLGHFLVKKGIKKITKVAIFLSKKF